ncbi:Alpha/Beta hydrolase protein [Butyriboletus roseoflavus]|nr:Alpha/Beta hydrolase protein [Butyriboletus roseoflavus]
MPLTDEQRNALPAVRAGLDAVPIPFGTAPSLDERARDFDPGSLPTDVTVRVEIAPPSPQPHPLLPSNALRTPERVPVYFFALSSDGLEVADTHVIFFIHGGANVVGHPTQLPFANFFIQLLRAVASHTGDVRKCVLIAPSYRLATVPENTFPAALQDLVAAYDHVLGKGYKPSNIVIAGDSAGGNHAVVLTHLILQSDRQSPRGVIPIAPAAIQVYDQMSEYAKAQASHDIIGTSQCETMASAYVGNSGVARTDPLVSGAFIPFTASWPKTLILVGTADQLIDASRELEKRLTAAKRPVELVEYDERPHGWWVLAHIFPDNIQDAAQRVAQFLLH